MISFLMKLFFHFFFIILFWTNISYAGGYDGNGKLKIDDRMIDSIIDYLGSGGHQKNSGVSNNGRGLYFAITTTGDMIGYSYCPHGMACRNEPLTAIKACRHNVKEYLSSKEKCNILLKARKIVWNNGGYKIPYKATREEILTILMELGFYGENIQKTNSEDKSLSKEVVDRLTDLKKLYDQGVLTEKEFTKAKKRLLN
jgi:hypothetical protein